MTEKRKIAFDILDSIRGIASLYVAIAHCRGLLWVGGSEFTRMFPTETWSLWEYAIFGASMLTRLAVEFVIVFFVLSGFSIAHSLSENKSALQFYKRRLIRIYPAYVIALVWAGLVYVVTKYWHPEWYDGSLRQFAFTRTIEMKDYLEWNTVLKNLFYMPGQGFITPFWSLTYEIIFYLFAPFLLRRINLYVMCSIILFTINLLAPSKVLSLNLPFYFHEFLFVYNIYFAIGVLLYRYYTQVAEWWSHISGMKFLVLIFFLISLMYATNIYFRVETVYSFVIAAFLGVILILYFLQYSVRIPWLIKVGKFSYTLYITHFASIFLYLGIYWLWVKPSVPYILNFFVWIPAVFFTLLVAYFQYKVVEKRTKIVLNRLRAKGK